MDANLERLQTAIRKVSDFDSLLVLLRDELHWEIDPDLKFDEVTFDWSADELSLSEPSAQRLRDGIVRQLRPMRSNQPWGIFLVEFAEGKVYREALRQILRRLVPNRRRDSNLAAWQHENLLFICAAGDYRSFTFAHFRGAKTPTAKLSTFGWQVDDRRLRTLCEFNLPALVWPEDDGADVEAWVGKWTKAFDKEPLTRDFFKRFDKALERIKADLEELQKLPAATAYTKGQLLLERLIFLYYLQNRGWLNQQRNYLLDNFAPHRERPREYSYYSDSLEKLFWTLASPPGSAARLHGIPFLNGGLFDDDEFAQNPMRRKHNPPLSIRNSTFSFVFDEFLEAFNFTVREDTPLNQEVAVDPEMLGKVFESIILHAEAADPDAIAPDKRKATGSYYTPRIVVHFICQETLRQYLVGQLAGESFTANLAELIKVDASDGLDKDELLQLKKLLTPNEAAKILPWLRPKCCDPAVGSGAFPVGLLHELVNLKRVVDTVANGYVDPVRKYGTQWLHETKSDIIQNCLYGVDIQQQAIEICQLRLWLSLVVDYDLGIDPFTSSVPQFREAIDRISQLPNLEMNFRRGDSLYDYISGVPLLIPTNQASSHRADFDEIKKLGGKLHVAKKGETKRNLRLAILERRLDISDRVLESELQQLRAEESTFINRLFKDDTATRSDKRKRKEEEISRVEEAQKKVTSDRRDLDRLKQREAASDFQQKLRKLEGADFNSPFNFAWTIDLATIFSERDATVRRPELTGTSQAGSPPRPVEGQVDSGGFDLIVGNPPFVTVRNPAKRELYRERWKRVCKGKYLLVCPFFELSFSLLRPGGQLGFIVSNAFAKREFGQPLVEDFFPSVDLQKVVDCSGLSFPGHGTPTFIIFGSNRRPQPTSSIRVAATLPGGGDLRTPPEESSLWNSLSEHHDAPGYLDSRLIVADRQRSEMSVWPWNLDASAELTRTAIEHGNNRVDEFVSSVGVSFFTNADEVFLMLPSQARRLGLPSTFLVPCQVGEQIRNWSSHVNEIVLKPYDDTWKAIELNEQPSIERWLSHFRAALGSRATFQGPTYDEAGQLWYGYHLVNISKLTAPQNIAFTEIATHGHFVFQQLPKLYKQTAPIIKLPPTASDEDHHLLAGLLNSSAGLFWLKQVCFNKGAGEDEERDRFVYAGGKVEQLPVPLVVAKALEGVSSLEATTLTELSRLCWEQGRQLASLSLKKFFEMKGEAFQDWNAALPGFVPGPQEFAAFGTTMDLATALAKGVAQREDLRAKMIALQEEMDWLVYSMYGLVDEVNCQTEPLPLKREERVFQLWGKADSDFTRALTLIPSEWPEGRRGLWRERLESIRNHEHLRRIEQPGFKRRWEEQWKVGNHWQCGQPAYDAELIDAFNWWLSEKAEWWLEQRGVPVSFDAWAIALWRDTRIQAAWPVVAEAQHRLELWKNEQKKAPGRQPILDASPTAFIKLFKALVKDQSVPEGIPFGVPYDNLRLKVSAHVKSIRGKLNVPRERFNVTEAGLYRVATPFDSNKHSDQARSSSGNSLPFE